MLLNFDLLYVFCAFVGGDGNNLRYYLTGLEH